MDEVSAHDSYRPICEADSGLTEVFEDDKSRDLGEVSPSIRMSFIKNLLEIVFSRSARPAYTSISARHFSFLIGPEPIPSEWDHLIDLPQW